MTGIKHDAGKPRCGLTLGGFARALTEVSRVGTFGAVKYTDNGWVSVSRPRYEDAMLRHYLAHARGEHLDAESGLSHLAHMAWCALAVLDLALREDVLHLPSPEKEETHA